MKTIIKNYTLLMEFFKIIINHDSISHEINIFIEIQKQKF